MHAPRAALLAVLALLGVTLLVHLTLEDRREWLLYVALGLVLTSVLLIALRPEEVDERDAATAPTVLRGHKDDYAVFVTNMITKNAHDDAPMTETLSARVARALDRDPHDRALVETLTEPGGDAPTIGGVMAFMMKGMTERQLLRMGGEALWESMFRR